MVVSYHPDQYGNKFYGFKKYSEDLNVEVVRGSQEVFCSKLFVESYLSDLQHCFVSSEGKTESYNELFRKTDKVAYIKKFLNFHPEVGGHFKKRHEVDEEILEVNENLFGGEIEISDMFRLNRKSLSQAYFNHQVTQELIERKLLQSFTFGPKTSLENPGQIISYKESVENVMKETDNQRKSELYKHDKEDCSEDCEKRGCSSIVSVDGLWKLTYKICMWEPTNKYPGQNISEYVPNACPLQPGAGSAFCDHHGKTVISCGYPSELRPFLKACGANPNAYTKEGKEKVLSVLKFIAQEKPDNDQIPTTEDEQGTGYFLRNKKMATKENLAEPLGNIGDCRKDIGEAKRLHRRSRGVECIVSGGGVIRSWTPLYKSEGPTQVALIMLRFLHLYFQGKSIEDFTKFFMSYDNICHVDELKLLAKKLDLPVPFDEIWLKINKVIDPLHIKNHSRPKCKELYNPEKVREAFPEANLMCAEQTFAWMGRYKKIFNSMTKNHFHFMLHRLIKGRNQYTSNCYKDGRKPLLPSGKVERESV